MGSVVVGCALLSLLSILCVTAGSNRATASGICRAGPSTRGAGLLLVLLPESAGLLSICATLSWRLDEGRSFSCSAGREGVKI